METKLRAELEEKLVEERKMFQQSLMETLKSMGLSQSTGDIKCIQKLEIIDGSGKGSCSAAKGSTKESTKDVEVDDVQRLLLMVLKLDDNHLAIQLSHCASVSNFYVSAKCIRELLVGLGHWLDVSILQIWCT